MAAAKAKPKGKGKKAGGRKRAKPEAPEVVARPESEVKRLLHGTIDAGPAEMVRAVYDTKAVDRYEARYRAGEEKAVEVFSGPSMNYLGDGGYRLRASRKAQQVDILANVRTYSTNEEAQALAVAFAVAANEDHGVYRTDEDKWAAVSAVIDRQGYQTASDREIGELCKVGHVLVGRVRLKLSADGVIPPESEAHASKRDYKEDAKVRGGFTRDASGNLVKQEPREGSVLSDPEPEEKTEEEEQPTDDYSTARFKDCPLLKSDGTHQQKGRCHVCQDRGWVTHKEWDALSDDLRDVAAKREADQTRVEVVRGAGVSAKLAGARKAVEEAQDLLRKLGGIAEDFLRSEHAEAFREAAEDNGVGFECDEDVMGAVPGDEGHTEVVKVWSWPALTAQMKTFGQLAAALYAE